jgi:hypothetical protein
VTSTNTTLCTSSQLQENWAYQPPARLLLHDDQCLVRFTTEDGRTSKDFDFAQFPVDRELQIAFATAFDRRTGPSGTCKAVSSALGCYHDLRSFAVHLNRRGRRWRRAAWLLSLTHPDCSSATRPSRSTHAIPRISTRTITMLSQ